MREKYFFQKICVFYEKSIFSLKNSFFRPGLRILNNALFSHAILGAFSSKTNFFVNFTHFTIFQLFGQNGNFSPKWPFRPRNAEMAICQKCQLCGPQKRGATARFWGVGADMVKFRHFTKNIFRKNENG